jgi:hypothetical protein
MSGKLKGRDHSEDIGVDEKRILGLKVGRWGVDACSSG